MQCFNETGGVIEDFRVGFMLDDDNPEDIRRVAIIEGDLVEFGRTPANAYIEEIEDPFWINDADHLYLNSTFEYGVQLRRWMSDYVMERGQVRSEMISVQPLELAGAGMQISPDQMRAFQDGRPLWRRSLFSCNPGQGKDGQSAIWTQLRDALLSWVVFCEMIARHAMQIDGKCKTSKFANYDKRFLSNLSKTIVGRALGHSEGADPKEEINKIGAPQLGIQKLFLGVSAHQYKGAHDDGRSKHFKDLFSISPKALTKLIRTEMISFKKKKKLFNAEFDASALVKWAATILIHLRFALTASMELDAKRNKASVDILNTNLQDERERLARKFVVEWLKGVRGVQADGTKRHVALEELLDLQAAALIAFATGINPRMLFPYINRGIFDEYDENTLLPSQLFLGAVWLGKLFRERYSSMDRYQAQAVVAFCNPHCLPRGLPHDRQDEWIAATRLITSFFTKKGFERLMDGANAVLNDSETRTVFVFESPHRKPQPKRRRGAQSATAPKKKHHGLKGNDSFLSPPIVVEAGWLILPGDYQQAWVGRSDPFEPEDFRVED